MNRMALRRMAVTALFVALILLLGMTPLGLIPLGFINVTILQIPVVVGTLVLGLRSGLLLGACFGTVSALSAFGVSLVPPSALASALVAASPLYAILLCILPRLLVPLSTFAMSKLLQNAKQPLKVGIACACGSLTNTVCYLGMMLLLFTTLGFEAEQTRVINLIIGGTGVIAGGMEALFSVVISIPVVAAIRKVRL